MKRAATVTAYRREAGAILHRTPDCSTLRASKDVVEIEVERPTWMWCKICCSVRKVWGA